MEKSARYITTTLPYVNDAPHLGHALEFVQADTLARFWRQSGHEVFFNSGTDEHGQKIADKADEKGESRQGYVDHYAGEFMKLGEALSLSYDNFIRTTSPAHKAAAQAIWHKCLEKGDIYKKKYSGLYCVGDEAFMKESDLVDGRCPNHPNQELVQVEEENYFFKLSNYQSYLEEYLAQPGVIVPEWRREEALNFVKAGLEDFSISREAERLTWGVPVPGDDTQVMYVWFDALTNYISTLGWPADTDGNFQKFWHEGETLQLAGKDQVRFQSIMWQAMLQSAGVKATDRVVYHGFLTSAGLKMSKSIGNVISPYELVARYGTDATRYLLLRHVHPFEDTDITWERLDEWYTANLVNGLGNLVARVMKMAETHLPAPVAVTAEALDESFVALVDGYDFQNAMVHIWEHVQKADAYIQETEPFKGIKSDNADEVAAAKAVIEQLVQHLYTLAQYLVPFMPATALIITKAVQDNKKPENLFNRLEV
ncbi:methionine--tRNA ligase [Patescibacteria group bacterium]|nr:methionine--tRNA ligase [Patescibacteria group bacterium]